MVDLKLPEGASLEATEAQAQKLEAILAKDADVENYVGLRRHRLAALLPAAGPAAAQPRTSPSSW